MPGITLPGDQAVLLSGLICSRLCHDLVGPAGAMANGLELCEDPAMVEAAMGLMQSTSDELNQRLAFFRRAYGTGGGLTWDEARDLTQRFLEGRRHQVTWHASDGEDGEQEARLARLGMNLILCAVDALPTGGEIVLEAGTQPRIEASGNLGDLENLVAAFGSGERDWSSLTPRDVQPHWSAMLAAHAGGRIVSGFEAGALLVLEFEQNSI